MQTQKKQVGFQAEEFVAQYLIGQNFTILKRNYTKPYGEIDIIGHKHNILVFVEVKMRHQESFDLTSVITPSKQRKIIMVAKEFITQNRYENTIHRFDVALVTHTDQQNPSLAYIPNAFTIPESETVFY